MSKKLIGVYGSLRKGLHNHRYFLEDATFIGEHDSEPTYSLYSLGSFPGLKENGNTSVKFEIYEVTEEEGRAIDNLEGYTEGADDNFFYDRKEIETEYGTTQIYIYMGNTRPEWLVESGDWKEFKNKEITI